MEKHLRNIPVVTAYNEFCAPSIEQAVKDLTNDGVHKVALITTMLTPGGTHSEKEIPAEVAKLRHQFPDVEISYAWPFDLEKVAGLLANHISNFYKLASKTTG